MEVVYLEKEPSLLSPSHKSDDDDDNFVLSFIVAKVDAQRKKHVAYKLPTTKQQRKVSLDSALKASKEKKKRRRLVKSRLVDERRFHS